MKIERNSRRPFMAAVLVSITCLFGAIAMATPSRDDMERNQKLIEASFDAWRAGTGSPFDLLAEGATWTIVGNSVAAKTYESREAFMREVIRPFNARMRAPLKPESVKLYADGNSVIAYFDASGTALDGKPYSNTYAWFMELQRGKIVRASAFFDSIEFNDFWQRVSVPAQ